ncbi:MAG: PspC domain-containing protein [Rikenellaceae bacterium]
MKTTKSVNIAGLVYTIDEDAYNVLSNYLSDIESRLDDNIEKRSILDDIEARISELLIERGLGGYKVVDINSVNYSISVIGSPSMFGAPKSRNFNTEQEYVSRRLLRDVDRRVLGGVCSGLAAFLNSDVSIVRVLIFLACLIGGSGLIAYIVCWIIIPAARSERDRKLLEQMKSGRI